LIRKVIFFQLDNGRVPVAEFLDSLSNKQVEKIFFVLDLIESLEHVPARFLKKLGSTDDIWEVRIQYAGNIFRLLGFFDGHNLIVLNHAFAKKTQKVPRKEIKIAEQRKADYFSRRQS